MRSYINILHNESVSCNNSRITSAHFSSSHKALAPVASFNSSNSCELLQKPYSQKITKPQAARLVHGEQSLSYLPTSKTITVLISFLKLGKYDDEWLKLWKQLLLLKKAPNKQKCYRSALCCFKSAIKLHPDNHVVYYFSGIT